MRAQPWAQHTHTQDNMQKLNVFAWILPCKHIIFYFTCYCTQEMLLFSVRVEKRQNCEEKNIICNWLKRKSIFLICRQSCCCWFFFHLQSWVDRWWESSQTRHLMEVQVLRLAATENHQIYFIRAKFPRVWIIITPLANI